MKNVANNLRLSGFAACDPDAWTFSSIEINWHHANKNKAKKTQTKFVAKMNHIGVELHNRSRIMGVELMRYGGILLVSKHKGHTTMQEARSLIQLTSLKSLLPKKSLKELEGERADIDRQLYATWMQEREEARKRIVELAVEFDLSAQTLGQDIASHKRRYPDSKSAFSAPSVELPVKQVPLPAYQKPKYENPRTGESWTGRGRFPPWLSEALAQGKTLDQFKAS